MSTRNILTVSVAQPFYEEANDSHSLQGVLGIFFSFSPPLCLSFFFPLLFILIETGVHLSLPRLKDSFMNLTAYLATQVILVLPDGTLVLDSCPPNSYGDPVTCPGLRSSSGSPFNIIASGGIYEEVALFVHKRYGGWANVTSGYKVTLQRQWVSFQRISDRNLLWIAVIFIDSSVYLDEVPLTPWHFLLRPSFSLRSFLALSPPSSFAFQIQYQINCSNRSLFFSPLSILLFVPSFLPNLPNLGRQGEQIYHNRNRPF